MTANTNLERRIAEHYASEPLLRAPDRVLHRALATIDTTKQRRGLFAPWRFTKMSSTYSKLAAAVAIVAVVAFGVWQLIPGPSTGGQATPTPSPSPTSVPTIASQPTIPPYDPPPLTGTFTSDRHGVSLSYPDGWTAQAATEPWTNPFPPQFGDPSGDLFYDPERDSGHLFIALGSRPLDGTPLDEWLSDFLTAEGCTLADPITIAGADEAVDTSCDLVLASANGRGYVIMLYVSGDEVDLRSFDTASWFEEFLATVHLRPGRAVD
jgi:hypothetical protein